MRVVVVDDQELMRRGLTMLLGTEDGVSVVGEAGDGVVALELLRTLEADVVLLDVRMPRVDGVEATRQICGAAGGPRVLILTTYDLDAYAHAALKAGASGFLLKNAPPEQLVQAVRTLAAGEGLLSPAVTRRVLAEFARRSPAREPAAGHRALDELTDRELEVLRMMARGLSNAEIAQRLFLGPATVKTHVSNILAKTGSRDRVQAVVFAHRAGLVG